MHLNQHALLMYVWGLSNCWCHIAVRVCRKHGNIYKRYAASALASPSNTEATIAISKLQLSKLSKKQLADRGQIASKDIDVDNLSETLEAHRASNRASVIRKIKDQPIDDHEPVERPSIRFATIPVGAATNGSGAENITGPSITQDVKVAVNENAAQKISGNSSSAAVSLPGLKRPNIKRLSSKRQRLPPKPKKEVGLWPADSVQAMGRERHMRKMFIKSTEILEYQGTPFGPESTWKPQSDNQESHPEEHRPWLAYLQKAAEKPSDQLSREILAFEAYMRLTPAEEATSNSVISEVSLHLNGSFSNVGLTIIGSRSTGTATPLSDFDFSIILPSEGETHASSQHRKNPSQTRKDSIDILYKVMRQFRSSRTIGHSELVRARVPIARAEHLATGLGVEVQTMASYQAAQQHVAAYLTELPSLRPLYVVLRYCLQIRGLTTVYEGGLGSYSLFMMIVTALKHASGQFRPDDLAGQLLHILNFYAGADLYKYGFSADPPRIFEKRKEKWSMEEAMKRAQDPQLCAIDMMQKVDPQKPYLLCLQDPANDMNNLGKNAYGIKHIQAIFIEAHAAILRSLQQKSIGPLSDRNNDDQTFIVSYLDPLVRASYRTFEAHRSRVERYANEAFQEEGYNYSPLRIRADALKRVNEYKARDGFEISPRRLSLYPWNSKPEEKIKYVKTTVQERGQEQEMEIGPKIIYHRVGPGVMLAST